MRLLQMEMVVAVSVSKISQMVEVKRYILVNGLWIFDSSTNTTSLVAWVEGDKVIVNAISEIGNNSCATISGEDEIVGSDFNGNNIDKIVCVYIGALPVIWQSHTTAMIKNGESHITWSVATQLNNEKYVIEHSNDGRNFSTIGKTDGDRTSNETKHYEYIHSSPFIGINYYRIKQVDYNGQYSYSDIASVRYDGNGETNIYPNPATSEVTITTSEPSSMQIFDVYGRVLSKQDISEGQNSINISALPSGILIFVVRDRRYKVLKE